MESLPGDPYERQLLEVFKSCDCDGKGLLDNDGLARLCELLHLEDGRDELMSFLLPNGTSSSAPSISFVKFRDALLALLDGMGKTVHREPSPDREVSPKYVVGQKKYGRRSRPESTDQPDTTEGDPDHSITIINQSDLKDNMFSSQESNDRDDFPDTRPETPVNSLIGNKECEDSGESELRNAWERLGVGRDGHLHRNELAMVCSAVGMDTMADQVVAKVFSTLKTDDEGRISFEEFLALFRSRSPVASPQILENSPQCKSLHAMDLNDLNIGEPLRLFQDLQIARSHLEAVTEERDKLRADLADANHRATILAQEIDEHHARIEKSSRERVELLEQKHSEELKDLKSQMSADKELLLASNQKLESSVAHYLEQLSKLGSELSSLKKDYEALEKENQALNSKLAECDSVRRECQQQMECMEALHQRVIELEALNEQSGGLLERVNCLQAENTALRDKNDELTSQLEVYVSKSSLRKESSYDLSGCGKRRGKSPEMFSEARKVRRCSTETDLSLVSHRMPLKLTDGLDDDVPLGSSQSLAFSFLETDADWTGEENVMEKMRARIAELEATVDRFQMKEWLSKNSGRDDGDSYSTYLSTDSTQQVFVTSCENSLVDVLSIHVDDPKGKVIRVEASVQTDSPSVHLQNHCLELENELERVRDKIINILTEQRACTQENCALKQTLQTLMNLKSAPSTDPENETEDVQCLKSALPTSNEMECLRCHKNEVNERLTALQAENECLVKRCQDLEGSLELMRIEYEKTEEYWSNKLDEERKLVEIDQQQSDEKFAELELKIQEYAELLSTDQSRKLSLPPIEEKDFLERQFMELEEEYETFKLRSEEILNQKDKIIEELKDQLKAVRPPKIDKAVQASSESRFGAKHRYSTSSPKDVKSRPSDCLCGKVKFRDRLKFEVENLCTRKQVLINQIGNLQAAAQLSSPMTEIKQLSRSITPLSSKLSQQDVRFRELETALRTQQQQSEKIVKSAVESHKKNLNAVLQSLMAAMEKMQTQEKVTQQKLERLAIADGLIKDLFEDNAHLKDTIKILEQKIHSLSQSTSNSF